MNHTFSKANRYIPFLSIMPPLSSDINKQCQDLSIELIEFKLKAKRPFYQFATDFNKSYNTLENSLKGKALLLVKKQLKIINTASTRYLKNYRSPQEIRQIYWNFIKLQYNKPNTYISLFSAIFAAIIITEAADYGKILLLILYPIFALIYASIFNAFLQLRRYIIYQKFKKNSSKYAVTLQITLQEINALQNSIITT